ncbi:Mu-like prophage major head subunit gpT family protein [Ochrobactrum sp. A-1]|uniref:Mu-like prophage major head subunit gpT family protein n=1 Tax=Ochrobactrum sp. A-1 TaxID=2920940 RepID=UPI001F0AE938|nr:Mu-like prophage major head subunit gpT family protein [Ochrobactrum sp. A-1]
MTNLVRRFQAQAKPNSYDPETRSFTVVVATSAPVNCGSHFEVLDLASFGADGWPESLPLQTDHSISVRDTVGILKNFRLETIEGNIQALIAEGRLSSRADNDALAANLKDGVQSSFSISFSVSKWRDSKDPETGRKIRTALSGKLIEGSFVVNPADPHSKIRSSPMDPEDVIENNRMSVEQWDTVCRAAGVPDAVREALRNSDAPDSERTALALAAVERGAPPVRTIRQHNDETLDNPVVLRNAVVNFYDAVNRGEQPNGQAAEVFAQGERALAERLCRNAGIATIGLSDAEVVRRAATTSDFPLIAGGTFNLAMRRELDAAASPMAALFGRDSVSTFNAETRGLADWTSLAIADKLESGEYKHSFIHETGETVSVAVIGGITSKSYELTINAGSRLGNDGTQFGKRMAAEIADRQVAYVQQGSLSGPKMKDGQTVFHTSRGNIVDFTLDGLTEVKQIMGARSAMAKRKGVGDVMIGVYPTHWLVHSDFEETALRLLASIQASAIADVNPLAGKLQVVVEPRLTDPDASWLVAAPSKMDGAVRVYLQGQEAPFTDSRIDFNTDAVQFKIRHPFGLGWLEWRSWTRLDHKAE